MPSENGKAFFVVEQYHHGDLVYWRAGFDGNNWARRIEDAVKFYDVDSANLILTRLCDGVGRSVEHMMVSHAE